jgi:hypothetical protein
MYNPDFHHGYREIIAFPSRENLAIVILPIETPVFIRSVLRRILTGVPFNAEIPNRLQGCALSVKIDMKLRCVGRYV